MAGEDRGLEEQLREESDKKAEAAKKEQEKVVIGAQVEAARNMYRSQQRKAPRTKVSGKEKKENKNDELKSPKVKGTSPNPNTGWYGVGMALAGMAGEIKRKYSINYKQYKDKYNNRVKDFRKLDVKLDDSKQKYEKILLENGRLREEILEFKGFPELAKNRGQTKEHIETINNLDSLVESNAKELKSVNKKLAANPDDEELKSKKAELENRAKELEVYNLCEDKYGLAKLQESKQEELEKLERAAALIKQAKGEELSEQEELRVKKGLDGLDVLSADDLMIIEKAMDGEELSKKELSKLKKQEAKLGKLAIKAEAVIQDIDAKMDAISSKIDSKLESSSPEMKGLVRDYSQIKGIAVEIDSLQAEAAFAKAAVREVDKAKAELPRSIKIAGNAGTWSLDAFKRSNGDLKVAVQEGGLVSLGELDEKLAAEQANIRKKHLDRGERVLSQASKGEKLEATTSRTSPTPGDFSDVDKASEEPVARVSTSPSPPPAPGVAVEEEGPSFREESPSASEGRAEAVAPSAAPPVQEAPSTPPPAPGVAVEEEESPSLREESPSVPEGREEAVAPSAAPPVQEAPSAAPPAQAGVVEEEGRSAETAAEEPVGRVSTSPSPSPAPGVEVSSEAREPTREPGSFSGVEASSEAAAPSTPSPGPGVAVEEEESLDSGEAREPTREPGSFSGVEASSEAAAPSTPSPGPGVAVEEEEGPSLREESPSVPEGRAEATASSAAPPAQAGVVEEEESSSLREESPSAPGVAVEEEGRSAETAAEEPVGRVSTSPSPSPAPGVEVSSEARAPDEHRGFSTLNPLLFRADGARRDWDGVYETSQVQSPRPEKAATTITGVSRLRMDVYSRGKVELPPLTHRPRLHSEQRSNPSPGVKPSPK